MAGIDRDYWLDYAKTAVTNSIESRDKAADKLDTFLNWLWTIYTSVFVLASLFDYMSSDFWQIVLVSQPIIVIMIARYFCTMVSMPGTIKADPNVVAQIIEGHMEIVESKKNKLSIAIVFTFISIISLSIALVGYNLCDPNRKLKSEIQQLKLGKEKRDNSLNLTQLKMDSLKMTVDYLKMKTDSVKTSSDWYDLKMKNILIEKKFKGSSDSLKRSNK